MAPAFWFFDPLCPGGDIAATRRETKAAPPRRKMRPIISSRTAVRWFRDDSKRSK
jgi:hypothetical protein